MARHKNSDSLHFLIFCTLFITLLVKSLEARPDGREFACSTFCGNVLDENRAESFSPRTIGICQRLCANYLVNDDLRNNELELLDDDEGGINRRKRSIRKKRSPQNQWRPIPGPSSSPSRPSYSPSRPSYSPSRPSPSYNNPPRWSPPAPSYSPSRPSPSYNNPPRWSPPAPSYSPSRPSPSYNNPPRWSPPASTSVWRPIAGPPSRPSRPSPSRPSYPSPRPTHHSPPSYPPPGSHYTPPGTPTWIPGRPGHSPASPKLPSPGHYPSPSYPSPRPSYPNPSYPGPRPSYPSPSRPTHNGPMGHYPSPSGNRPQREAKPVWGIPGQPFPEIPRHPPGQESIATKVWGNPGFADTHLNAELQKTIKTRQEALDCSRKYGNGYCVPKDPNWRPPPGQTIYTANPPSGVGGMISGVIHSVLNPGGGGGGGGSSSPSSPSRPSPPPCTTLLCPVNRTPGIAGGIGGAISSGSNVVGSVVKGVLNLFSGRRLHQVHFDSIKGYI